MNGKERLLAACRGQPVDRLPWAPRIEWWYNHHRRNDTLPADYMGWSMFDIIRDLGGDVYFPFATLHQEVFQGVEVVREVLVGSEHFPVGKKELKTHGIDIMFGGNPLNWTNIFPRESRVYYHTPVGTVTQHFVFSEEMEKDGVTVPYLKKHWFESAKDYPILEYLIENLEVTHRYGHYNELQASIGDDGVANVYLCYAPFHTIMLEYMGYERAIYELHDNPAKVEHLHRLMLEKFEAILDIAAQSPAEIIGVGGNWAAQMIGPHIYKKYILPFLQHASKKLHAANKLVYGHVDGDMRALFSLHAQSGQDIAEGFSPAPMCPHTLEDARAAYGDRMTIWGGLPMQIFSPTYSDKDFEKFLDMTGMAIGAGRRMVLSTGDNLLPDARIDRLRRVTDWATAFKVH